MVFCAIAFVNQIDESARAKLDESPTLAHLFYSIQDERSVFSRAIKQDGSLRECGVFTGRCGNHFDFAELGLKIYVLTKDRYLVEREPFGNHEGVIARSYTGKFQIEMADKTLIEFRVGSSEGFCE